MPAKLTLEEWLKTVFSKIKAESVLGCWVWGGGKTSDGYGCIVYKKKGTKVHRALYRCLYGELPQDINVLHRCDNRLCCNPFHWFTGTQADNVADCVAKGRHRGAPGEQQANHILTEKDVIAMRRLRSKRVAFDVIAKQFRVAKITAQQAITGHSWRHLPGAVHIKFKSGPKVGWKTKIAKPLPKA